MATLKTTEKCCFPSAEDLA